MNENAKERKANQNGESERATGKDRACTTTTANKTVVGTDREKEEL